MHSLQKMPKPCAMLCLELERFCQESLGFLFSGQEICVAYSGGADSKALLYMLLALRERCGFTLSMAHIDHGFRPESVDEYHAAEELSKRLGLRFYGNKADGKAIAAQQALGLEEAGRKIRLDFFASLTKANPNLWVATAHQLNDLAEDILMRLIRGSGWPALGGMKGLDAVRKILRPILLIPHTKLEEFLTLLGQEWINDPMNEDSAYMRNRIRQDIIPRFLQENPAFLEQAIGLWGAARIDESYWNETVQKIWETSVTHSECGAIQISRIALSTTPKALRLRLYKKAIQECGPGQALQNTILSLDDAFIRKNTGAVFQFPGSKTAVLEKDMLIFYPAQLV